MTKLCVVVRDLLTHIMMKICLLFKCMTTDQALALNITQYYYML